MNIGLVLSGGGIRGVAHIGAIKALEENNIFPTHISGTSAGAIVGSLYASGASWEHILHFFKTIPLFNRHNYARSKPGFLDTEKYYENFKGFFPEDDFSALKKPLYVTGTNIIEGTLKVFDKGPVIRPVLASASFPGMFTPIKIDGSYYVDGGVLNNFPIEPLQKDCDKIIGVYVNPLKKIKIEDLKHSYTVVERAYKLKSASESMLKFNLCDMIVLPEGLSDFGTFDMGSIDTIFELGYSATKKLLETDANLSNFKSV
ncbi:MAG: patatin-like phospholipase family protein [Cellulophaga sp.]|uniref:patatin-like phospholipase family protein n=1 Tax=unclassified Cellulophaga TaxID=2634405 RepID=UPI000C2CB583|nr:MULTISPECIES: patatin-like phospholipase family protein [unclassified Cellulophaga]MDO6492274.1 patatin-like phospholipase family protein [Cellulophaga sp. 2_MG-2023]MDO6493224.1 patatin-like phospholipase family protein [Cellulophaga sp. 3_MG-2023]PKB44786.1 NTE family protein [Cellulophaga sp. RHA19]